MEKQLDPGAEGQQLQRVEEPGYKAKGGPRDVAV